MSIYAIINAWIGYKRRSSDPQKGSILASPKPPVQSFQPPKRSSHFCHESNLRLNENDYPTISILPGSLQIPTIQEDPNLGGLFI